MRKYMIMNQKVTQREEKKIQQATFVINYTKLLSIMQTK